MVTKSEIVEANREHGSKAVSTGSFLVATEKVISELKLIQESNESINKKLQGDKRRDKIIIARLEETVEKLASIDKNTNSMLEYIMKYFEHNTQTIDEIKKVLISIDEKTPEPNGKGR